MSEVERVATGCPKPTSAANMPSLDLASQKQTLQQSEVSRSGGHRSIRYVIHRRLITVPVTDQVPRDYRVAWVRNPNRLQKLDIILAQSIGERILEYGLRIFECDVTREFVEITHYGTAKWTDV